MDAIGAPIIISPEEFTAWHRRIRRLGVTAYLAGVVSGALFALLLAHVLR